MCDGGGGVSYVFIHLRMNVISGCCRLWCGLAVGCYCTIFNMIIIIGNDDHVDPPAAATHAHTALGIACLYDGGGVYDDEPIGGYMATECDSIKSRKARYKIHGVRVCMCMCE